MHFENCTSWKNSLFWKVFMKQDDEDLYVGIPSGSPIWRTPGFTGVIFRARAFWATPSSFRMSINLWWINLECNFFSVVILNHSDISIEVYIAYQHRMKHKLLQSVASAPYLFACGLGDPSNYQMICQWIVKTTMQQLQHQIKFDFDWRLVIF